MGAVFLCALLIAGYFAASLWAVFQKSATADEPLHALAAYERWFDNDFRLNPEDPPLWGYLAMLPHERSAVKVTTDAPSWRHVAEYMWSEADFVTQTLYRTPDNDPEQFINRSRVMMALLAAALAALLATWAWQFAGPGSAVIATTLYCFDPTFIGHGPLVKDDVPMALALLLCAWTIWRVGQYATVPRIATALLALAAGFNTKFSGVLLAPIALALLAARAALPRPWLALRRVCVTRAARFSVAGGIAVAALAAIVVGIWACYGFRFLPAEDPSTKLNLPIIATAAKWTTLIAADPHLQPPSAAAMEAAPMPSAARLVLWANDRALLPQAYLAGFLDTYATTLLRPGFLLGEIRRTGWWYYFPLALLFKLPLATIAAGAIAALVCLFRRWRKRNRDKADLWTLACLWIPLTLYGGAALRTHLNLGVRHVLPICPFIFLLSALSLNQLLKSLGGRVLLLTLLAGLIVESARAFPDDIAFFNAACGGSRGGLRLLGDSNLDWGQDLPLLNRWRAAHPENKLYIAYFGMADPGYYIADYTPLPGNSGSLLPQQWPNAPGVLAISASILQGTYLQPNQRLGYQAMLARCKLVDVLGGTIYLYELRDAPKIPGPT